MKNNNPNARKALIIEDESDMQVLLGNILREKEIQPVFAGSIAEADEILATRRNDFRFIFLDHQLPDGWGLCLLPLLKDKFPASRLIMISANDSYKLKSSAQRWGASLFIGKPFSRDHIVRVIEQEVLE